jgi:hypothetical protein
MVTNYPHRIASDEAGRTTTDEAEAVGLGGRTISWVRQALCGLHGHDNLLQFQQDRMFLRCASCGRESPGWSLNETPPHVTVRGDTRRHAVVRPHLISARRIA